MLETLLFSIKGAQYPGGLDSWEVFKVAAHHDDQALATAAVKRFADNGYTHRLMFHDRPEQFIFAAGLPPKYAVALHRHAFSVDFTARQIPSSYQFENTYTWTPKDVKTMGASFKL